MIIQIHAISSPNQSIETRTSHKPKPSSMGVLLLGLLMIGTAVARRSGSLVDTVDRAGSPVEGDGRASLRRPSATRVGLVVLQRPLELELDLLLVVAPLVLDGELRPARDPDPFTGDLDAEGLVRLERVGQPTELGDRVLRSE